MGMFRRHGSKRTPLQQPAQPLDYANINYVSHQPATPPDRDGAPRPIPRPRANVASTTSSAHRAPNIDGDAPRATPQALLEVLDPSMYKAPVEPVSCLSHNMMKHGGNRQQWDKFMKSLRQETTLLLWGPTGCGKSEGVRWCVARFEFKAFELDPSVVSSTEELKLWLTNVSRSRTLLGKRVIVIDDLEGLDESFLRIIYQFSKQLTLADTRLVLICTDKYNPLSLKRFRDLPDIRLWRPSEATLISLATRVYSHVPCCVAKICASHAEGDLRYFTRQLTSAIRSGHVDQQFNVFDSTAALLQGRVSGEMWGASEDARFLQRLLYVNYLDFSDNMDVNLVRADSFSVFEGFPNEYMRYAMASTFYNVTVKRPRLRLNPQSVANNHLRNVDPEDIGARLRHS